MVGSLYGSAAGLADEANQVVRLPLDSNYVNLDGGGYISTPDKAAWTFSGVFRMVIRIRLADWTGAATQVLACQYGNTGDRAWLWYIASGSTGPISIGVSSDGTALSTAVSTVNPGLVNGETYWLGIELNNSDSHIRHYVHRDQLTMPAIWSDWTKFSDSVEFNGVPSAEAQPLVIGSTAIPSSNAVGRVYNFAAFDGGVEIANPDFTQPGADGTGGVLFTDDHANEWTAQGTATWNIGDATQAPVGLYTDGFGLSFISSPDAAKWQVGQVGTVQMMCRMESDNWGSQQLLGQYDDGVSDWLWYIETSDVMRFTPNFSSFPANTTDMNLVNGTAYWLGVEYNGATGALAMYMAADSEAMPTVWSSWTSISTGLSLSTGGVVNSSSLVRTGIGNLGTMYRLKCIDNGTTICDLDFTEAGSPQAVVGGTTYTDPQANVWTLNGFAEIIGPNGPVGASNPTGQGATLDGTSGCFITTPDASKYNVAGVFTLLVCAKVTNFANGIDPQTLIGKYNGTGGQYSWIWALRTATTEMQASASSNGTSANLFDRDSNGTTMIDGRAYWFALEVDLNDLTQSLTYRIAAYAPDPPTLWDTASWVTISGSPFDISATGTIADTSALVTLGALQNTGAIYQLTGTFYKAIMYDDGVLIANADFTETGGSDPGDPTHTDSTGNVWTLQGTAAIEATS